MSEIPYYPNLEDDRYLECMWRIADAALYFYSNPENMEDIRNEDFWRKYITKLSCYIIRG